MSSTWIKICGITRPQDAQHAAAAGADAVGLVLVQASARFVSLDTALAVRRSLPESTQCVLLFLNPAASQVCAAIKALEPDLLQFHGTEPASFCDGFGVPYIKALSAGQTGGARAYPNAWALLLDSHQPGGLGGTGKLIDDQQIPGDIGRSWVLAGGLNPDNVAERLRIASPFGVDVSSGVECRPGIKDPELVSRFVATVRDQDKRH